MHDAIPLRTVFALRQFAAFTGVDLAELAVIAENVREVRLAAGTEIAAADARLPALHLILEGEIEVRSGDRLRRWGQREVFGLLEVLADRPLSAPAIAATTTRTLALRAADTREILEDNFGVLHAVIRALGHRTLATTGMLAPVAIPSPLRLTLVERLIVLRQLEPFAGGRLHALAALASGCEEVVVPRGELLGRASKPPDGFAIVLSGEVHAQRPGELATQPLQAGESVGVLEAIAGRPFEVNAEAVAPTRLLRCSLSTLIDVLEDHTDLGLAMVSNAATRLLDHHPMERDLHEHVS